MVNLSERLPVAVLGATGSVGQKFVALLADHPWFEVVAVTASDRSAGKLYSEAVGWVQPLPIPAHVAAMTILPCEPPGNISLAFSALDASVAGDIEVAFAEAGCVVVSNARNHRMAEHVPLLIPEVNADHLALVDHQPYGSGGIITNPNCSTIGLVLALKPLHDEYRLQKVHVVTMQAISGAGLPGLSNSEFPDNVIPYIAGEEEKIRIESQKILGQLNGSCVESAGFEVSAQCNRVPVMDGHMESVSVALEKPATIPDIIRLWEEFRGDLESLDLPSAPKSPLVYMTQDAYPQPRLHRDLGKGMTVSVGRLQPCPILGFKFVVLSHNTIRGAAGGAILAAELAVARGLRGLHHG